MPFPKSWDKKVKVAAFPFRRNNSRICHNCWTTAHKDNFDYTTGMCANCQRRNRGNIEISQLQPDTSEEQPRNKCVQCGDILQRTNFGICRLECEKCLSENVCLTKRCVICDSFGKDYWNNICPQCLGKLPYLCENNGKIFFNKCDHFKFCWCLTQREQILRGQMFPHPPSYVALATDSD